MTEKQLEAKLKKEVEKLGGLCLKLVTPGFTGIPDRLILLPGGKVWFVEVKKPDYSFTSDRQHLVCKELKRLGFNSFRLNEINGLNNLIRDLFESQAQHAGNHTLLKQLEKDGI
jgi:hypothetical protein